MECLTDRDAKVLDTLGAFGLLSTRQIAELFFPGTRKTTVCRRLRTLEERGIIRRVRGLPDGSVVWTLSRNAAHRRGLDGPSRNFNRNTLEHDVVLSDVRMALTRLGLGGHWIPEHELRRKAWKEHYQKGTRPEVIPDALLTVRASGEYRVIAVEVELKMKSRERYKKIFQSYGNKSSIWMIWYLVPTARMGKRIEALYNKVPSYLRSAGFMWSLLPELLEKPAETKLHNEGKEHLLTRVLTP